MALTRRAQISNVRAHSGNAVSGHLAQLVEHSTFNRTVVGSNPTVPTNSPDPEAFACVVMLALITIKSNYIKRLLRLQFRWYTLYPYFLVGSAPDITSMNGMPRNDQTPI